MEKENKTNEKIGDWLLDIAKYIITAIVITSFWGRLGCHFDCLQIGKRQKTYPRTLMNLKK
jgi:hypothetical protein